MRIDVNFGTLEILLGNLHLVFRCKPTQFSEFGYTTFYWDGRPIWFA